MVVRVCLNIQSLAVHPESFNDMFYGLIRKFHGHDSLKEYYEKESCVHYIHNVRTALM